MAQTNTFYHYNNADTPGGLESRLAALVSNQSDMMTINSNGGVRAWICPRYNGRRHFAWNPIVFKAINIKYAVGDWSTIPTGAVTYTISVGGNTYTCYEDYTSQEATELPLYNESHVLQTTLRSDEYKGVATFNVAPIVRTWFADSLVDICDYSVTETKVIDGQEVQAYIVNPQPMLYGKFATYGLVTSATYADYFVQNAVAQSGTDGDKSFSGTFLLNDNYVIRGTYPELTIIASEDYYLHLSRGWLWFNAGATYRLDIRNYNDFAIVENHFAGLAWEDYCTDGGKPAMVRWLNRKGGIDTYAFAPRQYKTKTSKTTGQREVYHEDGSTITSNRRVYSVEAERKIRMGAERITDGELDFLTRLPYSPYIEWYDPENTMWTGVAVGEFSNEEVTDAIRHDYEIEFLCPAVNMQLD